ncbi:IS110 family transposase [Pseudosulfitobacter sp. DSM 107133]|uniref:IS110 family transposase n=1 Tax=Pseudosulfitobacter sp. DSM 107133 TaxID=2883100 RepID=UPI001F072FCB|nr:IS110 family transposase [Pseudosulfitobacter sp. DSM 107133]UOA26966.1 hypothetical protein DSM107133_01673 [Pseudosulfitobacter sp. DSM 107133]
MEHYAGLDVSLKEISICVVDHDGKTVARGTCPADPEGVAGWFRNRLSNNHYKQPFAQAHLVQFIGSWRLAL